MSSQPCEDTFNFQKNSKVVKGKKKFRRPAKVMSVAIDRQVLSKMHKFKEVEADEAIDALTARLPKNAYQCSDADASLKDIPKIVSTQASPSWYSPQAVNWSQQHADLHLVAEAHLHNSWAKLKNAWLGCLFQAKHKIIVKTADKMIFGGCHFADSAVVAFPARVALQSEMLHMFEPDIAGLPPCGMLWACCSLEGVEAVCYKWRSPYSQIMLAPAAKDLPYAVRAVATTSFGPVLHLAARHAFWNIDKATLMRFAEHERIDIPKGSSLFDTLWYLIEGIFPKMPDEELMELCCMRLGSFKDKLQWSDELADIDEAREVLDRNDQSVLETERKAVCTIAEHAEEFKRDYTAKFKVLAKPAAAPKKKGKKTLATPRLPLWPDNKIPLAEARLFLPRDAQLWSDDRFGNWHGELKPFPRIGRAWKKWGEKGALIEVLRYLWSRWAEKSGKTMAEIPLDGLFPESAPAVGTGAAASSSS